MATKQGLERLLKKGSLTGREAARLIIGHFVEEDHNRPGYLSERDIRSIKTGLTSDAAVEYNRWVDTYRIIDRTLLEARIQALEAEHMVSVAIKELERFHTEHKLLVHVLITPAIVTEKQYQELKASQREKKLQEMHTLADVFDKAAFLQTPELKDEWRAGDEEGSVFLYFSDFLRERYPDRYRQVVIPILERIQSSKLRPVMMQEKEREQVENLQRRIQAVDLQQQGLDSLQSLVNQKKQLLQQLYKASGQGSESIAGWLQRLLDGSLSEAEEERLLYHTYCSGAELYEADLLEWINEIDTYHAGIYEGDPIGEGVAILQEPRPEQLDERGYYKEDRLQTARDIVGLEQAKERWKRRGLSLEEFLQTTHKAIRSRVRNYLGLQSVVEAVSDALGVDFAEDLREWYQTLEATVEYYNLLIRKDAPYGPDLPKLPKIRIDNLKPTVSSLKYFRERIALGLGENWWQQAVDVIEFPAEEEESAEAKEGIASVQEV